MFLLFLMMFKDMATVSPHNLFYKIGSDMRFDFLNILWSVFESITRWKLSDLFFSRFSWRHELWLFTFCFCHGV